MPPLRERRGDVASWRRTSFARSSREVPALGEKPWDAAAIAALERYPFPGNVRELKTIVERAAYRDTTREINVEDLALPRDATNGAEGTFEERVAAFERQLVEQRWRPRAATRPTPRAASAWRITGSGTTCRKAGQRGTRNGERRREQRRTEN